MTAPSPPRAGRTHSRMHRTHSSLPRTLAAHAFVLLLSPLAACGADAGGGASDGEASEAAAPEILIVGTEHLAQREEPRPAVEVAAVVDSLRPYRPDMVVVEYLPASWPVGEGRDYRWEFDDASYAASWGVPLDSAGERLAALEAELDGVAYHGLSEAHRCTLARLHFLTRDRANALYYWTDADCPAESDSLLTEWIDHRGGHEMARVAFPLARASGLRSVVSFDYQGDDARWFLGPELFDEIRSQGSEAEVAALDSVMGEIEAFRAHNREMESGSYIRSMRYKNSAEWIETQRRLYEEVMPVLTYADSAGRRQTDNYWLRNERMFERIEEAVAAREPDRILVVVGSGHKYFLDELAERQGYRWVDPLEYLNN